MSKSTLTINKSKNSLPVLAQQKLDKLAREIRSRNESTAKLVKVARDKSREALAEALLCGQALNEAKKIVGHGAWLPWLKKHCKGVSEDTAQRYMRLANNAHVRNLKDASSLRQAYILVGILDDCDPETAGTHAETHCPVTKTERLDVSCGAVPSYAPENPTSKGMTTPPIPKVSPQEMLAELQSSTDRLIITINNYIQSKKLAPDEAREATLKRIEAWFQKVAP